MQHLIPFRYQKQWFAVEAGFVEQILGEQSWMVVPSAPALFPGVMAWRGRATAVLNLSQLAHSGPGIAKARPPQDRPPRTLIVHTQGCTIAIPTDEVREALPTEAVQLMPLRLSRVRFSSSEFELQGTIAVVLDLSALISSIIGSGSGSGSGSARVAVRL